MKKLIFKLIAAITVVAISVGSAASCGLFTVNTDRDMNRVAATVQISKDVNVDNVYKRDLIAGYMSYGYNYVQSYSYTNSQAYQLVLDNLVNNAIIVQQSRVELVKNYQSLLPAAADNKTAIQELYEKGYLAILATEADVAAFEKAGGDDLNKFVYDLYKDKTAVETNDAPFRFVELVDVYKAISATIDSVTALIDSVVQVEDGEGTEADEYESIAYTVRTVPTMKAEEDDDEDIDEYKANHVDLSGKRASNLAKAIERLQAFGLIEEDEKYTAKDEISILSLSYFKNNVNASLEAEMVSLYEEGLKNTSNIDYTKVDEIYSDAAQATTKKGELAENLWNQYVALQKKQEAGYKGDYASLETALDAVSDTSFVVYSSELGYSYVSHLVIEFSAEQKAILTAYAAEEGVTNAQVQAKVDSFVESIIFTDLRASWVQSNYGSYNGSEFTFSDKYVYDTDGALAKYNGTIGKVKTYVTKDEDDNDVTNLQFFDVKPNELSYADFTALAAKVVTGDDSASPLTLNAVAKLSGYDATSTQMDKSDFNRFEDLKFAFSIDTGNFNKYLGYVYSPLTSKDKYVKTFAAAAAEVSDLSNNGGVGAYKMFASSEYGLHIVMCTATEDYGYYTDKAAFVADLDAAIGENGNKESVAYLFMKANVDLVTNNYISEIAQSFINKYTAEGAKVEGTKDYVVNKYNKVYKDLITEE